MRDAIMFTLLHDLRIAARFLARNRTFAVASALILALGISLSATLFAIVKGALLEPWPYRGYERIVTMRATYPTLGRTAFSLWSVPEIDDLRRSSDIFAHVIAGDARNVNLTYLGHAERVRAAVITPNAFVMLGVPAFLGRALADADARPGATPAVVVSYRFWQTRLGADRGVVGRTLRIADVPYQIAGVMPESFVFWGRDLWMPLALDPADARNNRRYYVQAQLQPAVTLDAADARLRLLSERLAADHPDRPEYAGLGIAVNLLVEDVLRDLRPTLYLLLAAVALVLLVATANLANAMLAKGMSREGELAIRRAIGGSAGQLARQLLTESALIGAAGGVLGAMAAAFLLPQLLALIPFGYVPAEARVVLDWRIVAIATASAIACGLFIGVAPALRAAAVDPGLLLKRGDTRTGSRRGHAWRQIFVAAQLATAVVVLGTAASAWSSLHATVTRDPGYRIDGVWTARIALSSASAAERDGVTAYSRILASLRATSGISDAAMASAVPIGDLPTRLVSAQQAESARRLASLDASVLVVSPGFFRVLDLPIAEGRAFADADDRDKPDVAIISRALARRLWPNDAAVGHRINIGDERTARDAMVIGVCGDVDTMTGNRRPAVFVPIAQQPPAAVAVMIRTVDSGRSLQALDAAVRGVDADIPVYEPALLSQTRLDALGPKLLAVTLLAMFGAAVLALSSVGIYAVVSQSVEERAQELRIRLTFGAEPHQLFAREMRRAARLVSLSASAGVVAAVIVLRWLASASAGFAGSMMLPLVASTAALMLLALLATAVPAYRACRLEIVNR
jgi:putative ABC transport system permease protein